MTQLCPLCKELIDLDDPTNYHEVKVWVHGPKRDGATAREATGQIAHEACVILLANGQAPDQERLF